MNSALILFGHGARDPRWAEPFQRLQAMLQAQMPDDEVSLAFLELMSPRLPESIADLVNRGYGSVTVVPVFFGQGGHVLRDLPEMVEQLREKYPALNLTVAKAVGEDDAVLKAIAQYCVEAAKSQ
jgi:sirohydrochlorin cobaltochelatase